MGPPEGRGETERHPATACRRSDGGRGSRRTVVAPRSSRPAGTSPPLPARTGRHVHELRAGHRLRGGHDPRSRRGDADSGPDLPVRGGCRGRQRGHHRPGRVHRRAALVELIDHVRIGDGLPQRLEELPPLRNRRRTDRGFQLGDRDDLRAGEDHPPSSVVRRLGGSSQPARLGYPAAVRVRRYAALDAGSYAGSAVFALVVAGFASIPLYREWGRVAVGPYTAGAAAAAFLAIRGAPSRARIWLALL